MITNETETSAILSMNDSKKVVISSSETAKNRSKGSENHIFSPLRAKYHISEADIMQIFLYGPRKSVKSPRFGMKSYHYFPY